MSKIDKDDDLIKWTDISLAPNSDQTKAWMQVCYDYDTKYKYNWDCDFVNSQGKGQETKFKVSDLEKGDIIKVSGNNNGDKQILYAKVVNNKKSELEYEQISKNKAIETLKERNTTDNLEKKVKNEVERASNADLEVIYAKLQELKSD